MPPPKDERIKHEFGFNDYDKIGSAISSEASREKKYQHKNMPKRLSAFKK